MYGVGCCVLWVVVDMECEEWDVIAYRGSHSDARARARYVVAICVLVVEVVSFGEVLCPNQLLRFAACFLV